MMKNIETGLNWTEISIVRAISCKHSVHWNSQYTELPTVIAPRIFVGYPLYPRLLSLLPSVGRENEYQLKAGDALRLERYPQAWRKVMTAYRRVNEL